MGVAWARALARRWIPALGAAARADLARMVVQVGLLKGLHDDEVVATVTAAALFDAHQHLALFVDGDGNAWTTDLPEFQRVSDRRLVVFANDRRVFAFVGPVEAIDAAERALYRFRRGVR